jgi:sugar-specific transcriptional regulator TrmB
MNTLRVKGSMTISQLAEQTKISRPTIYLHLENLKKKGLISLSQDNDAKGKPVTIKVNEDSVAKKDTKELIEFLKKIKDKGEITLGAIKEEKLNQNNEYLSATLRGFIDKKIFLTEAGKKFLEENK